MKAKDISQTLAQRALEVASYLFPNGKRVGQEWRVGDIDGNPGDSLGIRLSGEKAGIWADFDTGMQKGDLLDAWAAKRKITLREAIVEVRSYLGIANNEITSPRRPNLVIPQDKVAPVGETKYVTPKEQIKTVANSSPVFKYLTEKRKITPETIKAFRLGQNMREIVFPYYRDEQLVHIKYISIDRVDGKKKIRTSSNSKPILFGWHVIGDNKTITLCEGEIDCLTLHQYGISALSVPFGGGSGLKNRWLENEIERLEKFDEIFLCFDQDPAGIAATNDLINRLGRHRCRVVKLPYKDPNECLLQGMTQGEIKKCFDEALNLDPEELKKARDYADEVINLFYPKDGQLIGYHTPWDKARSKILFRHNELSIMSGINGHGKSQLTGNLILSFLDQGARVCIGSFELRRERFLARLTRQAAGIEKPSENFIRTIHNWFGDNLYIFDLLGTAKVQRLMDVFEYAHKKYGVDVFIIDSFMKIGVAEDDYVTQKKVIEQLCDFKNEFNCHILLITHPRKADNEKEQMGKLDVKGTGAITDLADNCFNVWRNKSREEIIAKKEKGAHLTDKEEKVVKIESDCFFRCDKNRNGEWEGTIGLYFDKKSFQYLEFASQKPKPFVQYSELGYI